MAAAICIVDTLPAGIVPLPRLNRRARYTAGLIRKTHIYSICIHTSFGGNAEGSAFGCQPECAESSGSSPRHCFGLNVEGYLAGFAADSHFKPAFTFLFALLSNCSSGSRSLI